MKVIVISKKKVVSLKVKGFDIHSYQWDELGLKELNLRDFDGAILDLTDIDESQEDISWADLETSLNYDVTKDILLGSKSFIIVIGNPFIKTGSKDIGKLLGVNLELIKGKGDSIYPTNSIDTSLYKEYLNKVKAYDFSVDNIAAAPEIVTLASKVGYFQNIDETPYLVTRSRKLVAFSVKPVIFKKNYDGSRHSELEIYKGQLVFLPSVGLDSKETARILLEANIDKKGDDDEPEWVKDIEVYGQADIMTKIDDKNTKIEGLLLEKSQLEEELINTRKQLEVLYKSDKPLEESIKYLLKKVGLTVKDPLSSEKVEFYIEYQAHKFVVEVKSTTGKSIDQKGLRQVIDWQNDAYDETSEYYKPIVFASVEYNKPLDTRTKDILHSNLKIYANTKEIAVIDVYDLYLAAQKILSGNSSIEDLAEKMFNSSGLIKFE